LRQAAPQAALAATRKTAALVALTLLCACTERPSAGSSRAETESTTSRSPGAEGGTGRSANTADHGAGAASSSALIPGSPPPPSSEACADRSGVAIFYSPESPAPASPLRIIAVATRPLHLTNAVLAVYDSSGAEIAQVREHRDGPPAWWLLEIAAPAAGTYRAVLGVLGAQGAQREKNRVEACEIITVGGEERGPRRQGWGPVWPSTAAWGEATENLYSAWIERLFDAPLEEQPSWPALHDVIRDRSRNILHNHLGLGEDDGGPKGIPIDPDCADLPYFLRAYFAFKMALPFGFSACTRGGGGGPPACVRWHSNQQAAPATRRGHVAAFGEFLRVRVADVVHSGTGRIPADADKSDYYSVPLTIESLRPGAIYADPYGHVLVVARRIPETKSSGGVLLAVDGQPDGTVARRRYWRGNFLFAQDPALGSPGFKRFRPVIKDGRVLRALSNDEIARDPAYGDYSMSQYEGGVDGFYDKMDEVLSPSPRSPEVAMLETIQALEEQVRGRVLSVQNGQRFIQKNPEVIEMPEGASIFETTGAWEDFSTPSRDLRLLIAIDIVRGFPERVAKRPDRFATPTPAAGGSPNVQDVQDVQSAQSVTDAKDVRAALEARLARELASRSVTYERSDGSPFTLSLADVVARAEALEMAYNPNDCAEIRWGAPADSPEAKTCRRRAPGDQRAQMKRHRAWFHDRRRPARM
jgi:hypothetical protein